MDLEIDALRPLAREPPGDRERRLRRGRGGDAGDRARASRRRRSPPRAPTTSAAPTGSSARAIGGKVIVRTGRRIPGVTPVAGVHHPIAVVPDGRRRRLRRRAVARDRRTATSSRTAPRPSAAPTAARSPSTRSARRSASAARSTAGPKWTVSPIYEGMLKEEMDAAAERHPDVDLRAGADRRDAWPGWSAARRAEPLVIPSLNRDGDLLSDLVLPLFGSIAGAESVLLALDDRARHDGRDGRGAARDRAGAARARTSPTRWG